MKVDKRDKNKATKSAYARQSVKIDWERVEELQQQHEALLKKFANG